MNFINEKSLESLLKVSRDFSFSKYICDFFPVIKCLSLFVTSTIEVLHNRLLVIIVVVIIITALAGVRHVRVINSIIFWLLRLA